jgi:hypothetical protein
MKEMEVNHGIAGMKSENAARIVVQILSLDKTGNEKVLSKISENKEFVEQIQLKPTLLVMISEKINGRRENLRNQNKNKPENEKIAVPEDIILSEGMVFELRALAEKPADPTELRIKKFEEETDEIIAEGLALAKKMEHNMEPAEKPTGKKQKNGGKVLWEDKQQKPEQKKEEPKKDNQQKVEKKGRKNFDGTVIPLGKIALTEKPIFKNFSDEWSEFTFSLFAHPMSVILGSLAENSENEVRLTDFPEDFGPDKTAKVFMNLITRRFKNTRDTDFLIEFKYLGPANGHMIHNVVFTDQQINPGRNIYTTSKLKRGKMIQLFPIEKGTAQ